NGDPQQWPLPLVTLFPIKHIENQTEDEQDSFKGNKHRWFLPEGTPVYNDFFSALNVSWIGFLLSSTPCPTNPPP
ncbi:MAG: hypothetical protein ACI9TH_001075, partial [Kiritimatiellia bacterium]